MNAGGGPAWVLTVLWMAALAVGCSPKPARKDPLAELRVELPRAAPARQDVHEPFDLGPAHGCRVERLELYLAERPTEGEGRRVPTDALVIRLQLGCEQAQAWLADARMVWRAPEAEEGLMASTRTTTPDAPDGVLQRVFEVPADAALTPQGPMGELRIRTSAGDLDLLLSGPVTKGHTDDAGDEPQHDACAKHSAQLRDTLAPRFAEAPRDGPECNVLGWLAPVPCRDVQDTPWLEAALTQQRACDAPHVRALLKAAVGPPPSDFRIALRRDRCRGSFDQCPRYTLVLHANGVTVFHGEHLVNARGRSDGRTHARLLSGLWQHLQRLEVLTRKGGRSGGKEVCAARGSDRGALLTVQGDGRSRTLVDRDGCRAPFEAEELRLLANLVDAAAGVSAWTDPPPAYADRNVRVWKVSASATGD